MSEFIDYFGAMECLNELINRGYTICITGRRTGWGVDIRKSGDGLAGDEKCEWIFSSPDHGGDGTLLDAVVRAMKRATNLKTVGVPE